MIGLLLAFAAAGSAAALAGSNVTDFVLQDYRAGEVRIAPKKARATVVFFLSSVCPMSGDYSGRIEQLHKAYGSRDVAFVLVNANENESDAEVEQHRKLSGLTLPVLRDPGGRVADLLRARVTPTVVLIDSRGEIRYFGSIDDSRNPDRIRRRYVAEALDSVLAGRPVSLPRTRVMGCTIKNAAIR